MRLGFRPVFPAMRGLWGNTCLQSIQWLMTVYRLISFAWIVDNEVQGWDESLGRFEELGVKSVPVLQRGCFDDAAIKSVLDLLDLEKQEGFVVRSVSPFFESDMATHVAKYVREGHVQSDTHWTKAEIIKNGLRRDS